MPAQPVLDGIVPVAHVIPSAETNAVVELKPTVTKTPLPKVMLP
jgi:hypothetical protein